MAQIETWLNQEMTEAVKVQYLNGNIFSQDNAGNLIGVLLTKNGSAYDGGGSVAGNVIRADGVTVAVSGALSGNAATIVLPQSAYAVPGVVSIVIKLTVSGEVTTIGAVVANVYQSTTDSVVDPGTIIPSIETLIAAIDAAIASIPADYSSLWTSLAPAFSSLTNYIPGQYVTYNGAVYRFTNNHSAGAWDSSHVVAVTIGGELVALWPSFAPAFSSSKKYSAGMFVTYGGAIYKFVSDHSAGSWSSSDVEQISIGDELEDMRFEINDLYGDYVIEDIEKRTADETLTGYYITANGGIAGGLGDSFVVKRYDVEYGKLYHLYGGSVSLATSLPIAVFRNDLERTTLPVEIIANATASAQNYSIYYRVPEDGYIYIASFAEHGELLFYDSEKMSDAQDVTKYIDEKAPGVPAGIVSGAVKYDTYYITTNGGIASLGESATSFFVKQYPVEKGKKYVIFGRTVALAGSYPLAMYRTTGGSSVLPAGTILEQATASAKDFYTEFTPTYDGYVYIAGYTPGGEALLLDCNNSLAISYDVKALNGGIAGKTVWCLGDSIVYLGGSWAFQIGEMIRAGKVYNVGRGGATWADRGSSFIEYNSSCEIWNNPLRASEYHDGITESYSANLDLASCEPPINSNYTTVSNEIRFMKRLIESFGREEPDLIIVACGVNDSRNTTPIYSQSAFDEIFETALDDMTLGQRSTIGGGLRWCIETLMRDFPNADILIATPIQTAYNGVMPYVKNTCDWIRAFANRYALPVIDAYNESGICNIFETSGQNGRYLYDGLHPNPDGQYVMAQYYCHQVLEKFCTKVVPY